MYISDSVKYVGVNDYKTDLFEGQYSIPHGVAYNSYVILDEKICVMDTVDAKFTEEWFSNLSAVLGDRNPDYLLVHHMEPDHSASIDKFMNKYPAATIVSSQKAFVMMKQFFGTDFAGRSIVIAEGDTLELGSHTLNFVAAPMVHWPEVMVSYESSEKILFSADGFGKFGALDAEEPWDDEARRYYIGIVGKFGNPVQGLLKKAAALDIEKICPLHGPVLTENLGHYISLYDKWSKYEPEEEGILLAYTTVYGHTREAVFELEKELKANGAKVVVMDLARCDMAEAVANAFRYSKTIFATTTYNGYIYPFMKDFIERLNERSFQNRKVAFVENGTWASTAARIMKGMLENNKNLVFAENTVTLKSALSKDSLEAIKILAKEMA